MDLCPSVFFRNERVVSATVSGKLCYFDPDPVRDCFMK